ncbi:hypothetical protein ACFL3Q_11860, partial [Planctomycetota bacterium]
EVYFGTDAKAVKNATTASPEYKGARALGSESYDPGKLTRDTKYFWRIDQVNNVNPDSPWRGKLWSFTTADFLIVDDFERYDTAEGDRIWQFWHDGLGYGVPETGSFFNGNGTGAAVGNRTTASYAEESIRHSGVQSMLFSYDNNKQGFAKYSEVELTVSHPRDWTEEGVEELSLRFRGYPVSVGYFTEATAGIYTMTATGARFRGFHYAYKMLSGPGSIVAKVESLQNTAFWAMAGVMIRETLESDSKRAVVYVRPRDKVVVQGRNTMDGHGFFAQQGSITMPHWVKLERDIADNFTFLHSADGITWEPIEGAIPQSIRMSADVHVGLALSAGNPDLTCVAKFSNVAVNGTVSSQWVNRDVGIASNDAEPLYVAVSNSGGALAVVYHDNPNAVQIDTWTEWIIPLRAFTDQGVDLSNVNTIAIGLGTKGNTTKPGGSGKMYFDDIRLYRHRNATEEQTPLRSEGQSALMQDSAEGR